MHNRILIIDDDDAFRNAEQRILRKMQLTPGKRVEVHSASTGKEGLEILRQKPVDCVLLDHDMPSGNGLYWLNEILDIEPDQAVIMLTGHGSEQLAVNAMKNGAMDYLVKGAIAPDELHRTIWNAIEKVQLRRTIREQKNELMNAERQRVMIESLGTACHHIGQPATVISAYLEMMYDRETDAEIKDMIESCLEASEAIKDILDRLLRVSRYRSVPYLCNEGAPKDDEDRILEI